MIHLTEKNAPSLTPEQRDIGNDAIDTQLRAMGIDPADMDDRDDYVAYRVVTVEVLRALGVGR